jgi:hypothetical protein
VEERDPGLLKLMAPAVAMPASTELRISRTCWRPIGGDVVEQLRRRHEPALWAQFEQGQAAQAQADGLVFGDD